MRTACFLALLAWVFTTTNLVRAADWPRFRGANFDGISAEKNLNVAWPLEGPPQLWTKALGPGGASVVVRAGRLYTMGNVENQDIVYCFDAETGQEIWRFAYPCPLDKRSFEGGPAGTPTIDGLFLYTMSHRGEVHCLETDTGKLVWSKNALKEHGGKRPQWGYAQSPLVWGEALILDLGGQGASTVALNKKDGALLWKAGTDNASYSSPVPSRWNGQPAILIFKASGLVAMSAADGKEFWRFPWKTDWDVHSALPITVSNQVFISSGYKRGGALLDVSGPVPKALWENKNMCNQMNSSVLLGGQLYGVSGDDGAKATFRCVAWETGELKWEQKGLNCGALMATADRLIILSEKGELVIAEVNPKEFKPLARFQVLNGRCWVAPVLANGIIYCRSNLGSLVAVDVRPGAARARTTATAPAEFAMDFEEAALEAVPAGIATESGAVVKEADGNKFLQLPEAPAQSLSAQFGPVSKAGMVVTARALGTRKGRLFPLFGVGLGGNSGYRLQVAPGRKIVELLKADEVKATAPLEWTSQQWVWLRLQVRATATGSWVVEGKTWAADGPEPAGWSVSFEETTEPPVGQAAVMATPFSSTPVRFDDITVKPVAAR